VSPWFEGNHVRLAPQSRGEPGAGGGALVTTTSGSSMEAGSAYPSPDRLLVLSDCTGVPIHTRRILRPGLATCP
jgi:hypothetical protein